jgi:hypothetical protein
MLSPDFMVRLEQRLRLAEKRRRRQAVLERWSRPTLFALPALFAACWLTLLWTFGTGVRVLIGLTSFLTLLLTIAQHSDAAFLTYLGVTALPAIIDVLLLVGVVSWLVWAARPSSNDISAERKQQ